MWNLETWYDIKKKDIEELEKVDRMLIKIILSAPSSTPSALLYLEMGMIPLKYIIQARRLMFLRYILTQKDNSLLLKFFNAQRREPCKNDWVTSVIDDLEKLDLDYSFEEIKEMSKPTWLKLVKEACKETTVEDLLEQASDYSKGIF